MIKNKNIMNAKAVLFMFLISLISFTGFSHTDLRQNSDVDNIVCTSVDNITNSDVVSVDVNLQNSNFSAVYLPTKLSDIMIINSLEKFNQVTFSNYPRTDVGKEIIPYLFKPLATIRAINFYNNNYFNTKITNEKQCDCWLAKLTRNPRDGLRTT